jgi:bacterioferritin-associated ferredoxin
MKPKKSTRSLPSIGKAGARRSPSSGFEGLDPSQMGFDMPEWMETPAEVLPSEQILPKSTMAGGSGVEPETRSVVEGMKVVCICKGIKKRVFWNALDAGMCTHEDINRHTGSGSGSCQGRRCGPSILAMLKRLHS